MELNLNVRGFQYSTEKDLKQAFCSFLSRFAWQYMATWTFNQEITDPIRAMRILHRFMARFDVKGYFCSVEWHRLRDGVHLHGLIADWQSNELYRASPLQIRELWGLWFELYGFNRIETVRADEAARKYCSKYITKNLADWDLRWRSSDQKIWA